MNKTQVIAKLEEQREWAQRTLPSDAFKRGHIDGVETCIALIRLLGDEPTAVGPAPKRYRAPVTGCENPLHSHMADVGHLLAQLNSCHPSVRDTSEGKR